ncbi:MAG: polysaccharide biosynthesis C-terminal domain-containing protein [Saprospiraceae bacterium]|nr:polysaccharide biosynthesis C-terminal domain-containing protein [Saprospiraceae bacterium]
MGLFIDVFAKLLDKNFRDELFLVNILLLANIFMGLYSNFSSWYKLSDNNRLMAIVSVFGMLLMLVLNVLLIPYLGNSSAAYANLTAYLFICAMAYYQGQKKYPIPYPILKMTMWLLATVLTVVFIPGIYTFF